MGPLRMIFLNCNGSEPLLNQAKDFSRSWGFLRILYALSLLSLLSPFTLVREHRPSFMALDLGVGIPL